MDAAQHHHSRPHLLHAGHRPSALHRGLLAQAHRLRRIHRRRGQRHLRRIPRAKPERSHRSRQDARSDRRQAAAVRDADPHLLDLQAAARSLRHSGLGEHSALGLPPADRPRGGDDPFPLVGEPAWRDHSRGRRREAQDDDPEHLHRRGHPLVRVPRRAQADGLGAQPLRRILEPVPRGIRRRHPRRRCAAHRVFLRAVPLSQPGAVRQTACGNHGERTPR